MNNSSKEIFPNWIRDNEIRYDKKIIDIIDFYVIRNICNGVSSRGIDLKDYGWKNESKIYKELFKYILYKGNLKVDRNVIIASSKDINPSLKKLGINKDFYNKPDKSSICFIKNGRPLENLMFYIRCAIAHGRFSIFVCKGTKMYIMENISKRNGNISLKARMIIDEKILLMWKNIILSGYDNMQNDICLMKEKLKSKLISYISKNEGISKQEIIEFLKNQNEYFNQNELLEEFKKTIIGYDKKIKKWVLL